LQSKNKIILLLFLSLLTLQAEAQSKWPKITIDTIKNKDVPMVFNEYKIVFITDIHHGPYLSKRKVRKAVTQANGLKPDLIILGGDYVHFSKRYIVSCFNILKSLEAKSGVFGVLGNHDHWKDATLSRNKMREAGIINIDNQSFWIQKDTSKIKIGGVDDLWEGKQLIEKTIYDVTANDFVILVSHNPDYIEKLPTEKIDLVLSGHTHGGQVSLFGWVPYVPSKYDERYLSGYYEKDQTKMIVSNGIGKILLPIRLGVKAEINLIILSQ